MRRIRTAALLTAGLVPLLGMPAAAAAAETPSTLYVDNRQGMHCSDTGTGSKAVPYCTISAAAKVAGPGQTVHLEWGNYPEAVNLTRSGEPGKPITFESTSFGSRLDSLAVTGASHLVIRGLYPATVQVNRSADIELDRITSGGTVAVPAAVTIGDASKDVRLTRSVAQGVRVEGGAQRTVLGRNEINGSGTPAVSAQDAPGTVVTNNTLRGNCSAAVSLTGASTASAVFNNVVDPVPGTCPAGREHIGFEVAQSAVSGTLADYNLLVDGETSWLTAYRWAGTAYETAAALTAATGQGEHDILVLSPTRVVDGTDGSPIIDSGDPTAPGVLPTDQRGFPTADDPRQPNTGKNGGYIDRGHRETQDHDLTAAWVEIDNDWAPVGTTVSAEVTTNSRWPGGLTYTYDFGDGTPVVTTRDARVTHIYTTPCKCTVKVTATTGVGLKADGQAVTKVTAADPLTAGFTAKGLLPADDSAYGGHLIRPLTYAVYPLPSTKAPWPVNDVTVDFGDGGSTRAYQLDKIHEHTYAKPGDYTVTMTMKDYKGATSTASRVVRVDYAASGYVPVEPFRLLDTRSTATPVQGGTTTPVQMPVGTANRDHILSGGMASAVLNVTVTDATQDTHLSVWPAGLPRPTTSNVNVKAGGTSSNTVTVPIGTENKVLAQLNAGHASLIVDFVGYYQPNIGQRFTPVAPNRLLDTRSSGGALGAGKTRTVKVAGVGGVPAGATAVALNLTSTGTTTGTHVIAYPDPAKRPATSSLNPEPGQDKSNQAIVPVGPNGTIVLYNNAGSTDLILDVVGFYGKDGKALFTPVVPQRLADTRTTGKLGPGGTTTVAGIPAKAVGAVVNVTATDTTAPGYLTVYANGGTRPGASSLNTRPGATVPNHVTTPTANGRIDIFNSEGGSNHVITDLLGYFTQP